MQSDQTTPPKRIWADPPETFDGMDVWRSEPGGKGVEYILASEHAALIHEAEARGMERAVSIMKDAGDSAVTEAMGQRLCCSGQDCGCHGATVEQYLEHIIRSEAAAIRAAKATP